MKRVSALRIKTLVWQRWKQTKGRGGEEGGAPVQSADRHTPQKQNKTVKQIGKGESQNEFIASQHTKGGGKLSHAASKVF